MADNLMLLDSVEHRALRLRPSTVPLLRQVPVLAPRRNRRLAA